MNSISEIPFYEIQTGDKVISAIGTLGIVSEIIPKEKATRQDDNEIGFEWENGNKSFPTWHYVLTSVKYIGR